MLATSDYKKVLDIIDIAYALPNRAEMFQAVFEKLDKLIGVNSAAYIPWSARINNFQFQGSVLFNCSAQALRVYLDQFSAIDPYVQSGSHLANPFNSAVKVTDFMSASRYAETLYAREFAPLIPCFYEMNAMVGCQDNPLGGIALHRKRGEHDFRERDRKIMNLILPHLARAVLQVELMEMLRAARHDGMVVVGAYDCPSPKSTNGPDRPSSRQRPVFIKSERFSVEGESYPPDNGFSKLLCDYSLTVRQREIAILACRGFSNREIAGRLFICEQTVMDHLHDVFDKMKIRRRSELTAKVLGL